MNCPFCGAPMEEGHVATADSIGLFFMPPDIMPNRAFNTHSGIAKMGGEILDGPYSGGNYRLNDTSMHAFICKGCRKVIMDY